MEIGRRKLFKCIKVTFVCALNFYMAEATSSTLLYCWLSALFKPLLNTLLDGAEQALLLWHVVDAVVRIQVLS